MINLKFYRVLTVMSLVWYLPPLQKYLHSFKLFNDKSTCFLLSPWIPSSRKISTEGGGLVWWGDIHYRFLLYVGILPWGNSLQTQHKVYYIINFSNSNGAFCCLVWNFWFYLKNMSLQFGGESVLRKSVKFIFCKDTVEDAFHSFLSSFERLLEKIPVLF